MTEDIQVVSKIGPRWARNFFAMFIGQSFSVFGTQLVQFALIWWLTLQTGSATVLAIASIMGILPMVFLSPFAGALVDRWSRKRVMIFSDGLIALLTLVLIVLFAVHLVQVWHIYVVMFLRSAFSAFHWPAMQASITLMVPKEHFARISGLNQSVWGLANIAAPPLAALLLVAFPMEGVLLIDVVTALIAIVPLFFILIPQPEKSSAGAQSMRGEIAEGIRFLRSWRGALLLVGVFMLVNLLLEPVFSLMPILAVEHFGGAAWEFAALQSAVGIGMFSGGIALGVWGGHKRRIFTSLVCLVLIGGFMSVVGVTPSTLFLLAVTMVLMVGFVLPILNGSIMAVMQVAIPPAIQGRIFSLINSGATAMTPLGLAIAGPFSDAFGVQPWIIIAGVLMVALGIISLLTPSLMSIDDSPLHPQEKAGRGEAPPTAPD